MIKQTIYLVGQISKHAEESYNWRQRFEDYFKEKEYNLDIINPCKTEWNLEIVEEDYKTEPYLMKGTSILPSKDRYFVQQSTIGVANLNLYDPDKPFIGSMFELAWYFDSPEKVVIGIYDGPRTENINTNHPFVRQTVDVWVKNEQHAARLIERFFLR